MFLHNFLHEKRRWLLQQESHILCLTADCLQIIPLLTPPSVDETYGGHMGISLNCKVSVQEVASVIQGVYYELELLYVALHCPAEEHPKLIADFVCCDKQFQYHPAPSSSRLHSLFFNHLGNQSAVYLLNPKTQQVFQLTAKSWH